MRTELRIAVEKSFFSFSLLNRACLWENGVAQKSEKINDAWMKEKIKNKSKLNDFNFTFSRNSRGIEEIPANWHGWLIVNDVTIL